MLKIRLQRIGKRNNAAFRVVVTPHTHGPKSGRNVELLGSYSPHTNEMAVKADRVKYWMDQGAQPSETVHNLLVREKIIEGKKLNVLPKKSPVVKEEAEKEESPEPSADAEASEDQGGGATDASAETADAAPEASDTKDETSEEKAEEVESSKPSTETKASEGKEKKEEKTEV